MFLLSLLAAGALTIELSMDATCKGTEIELAEIATIHGADKALVAQAGAIEIGYAPSPGFSRVVRADRLAQIVRRQLPGVDVVFTGDRRTRVAPEVTAITGGELEATARVELVEVFRRLDADFRINTHLQQIEVPTSANGYTLRARPGSISRPTSGTFTVPVEVYVDGSIYRIIWTSWQANVYESRPVLAQTVRAGERLRPEMFETRQVRVTPRSQPASMPTASLVNAVASRSLAPGDQVGLKDVYRNNVIEYGARIQLLVTKGKIRAKVPVEAEQAGAIGHRIRVKNAVTGESMTAVVRSRDLVEIDLTR